MEETIKRAEHEHRGAWASLVFSATLPQHTTPPRRGITLGFWNIYRIERFSTSFIRSEFVQLASVAFVRRFVARLAS